MTMRIVFTRLAMSARRLAALAVLAALSAVGSESATAQAVKKQPAAPAAQAVATFAAGCFWCAESDFQKVPGVIDAVSGYTGGRVASPTYEQVSAGGTGHRESVEVRYDPARVSYATLLDVFWRNVDPFDAAGQFCDKGEQYTAAIYVHDAEQRRLAEQSLEAVRRRVGPKAVATKIVAAAPFYVAEAYHQEYYKKNPVRYHFYRSRCGRDARLEQVWGKAPAY